MKKVYLFDFLAVSNLMVSYFVLPRGTVGDLGLSTGRNRFTARNGRVSLLLTLWFGDTVFHELGRS